MNCLYLLVLRGWNIGGTSCTSRRLQRSSSDQAECGSGKKSVYIHTNVFWETGISKNSFRFKLTGKHFLLLLLRWVIREHHKRHVRTQLHNAVFWTVRKWCLKPRYLFEMWSRYEYRSTSRATTHSTWWLTRWSQVIDPKKAHTWHKMCGLNFEYHANGGVSSHHIRCVIQHQPP